MRVLKYVLVTGCLMGAATSAWAVHTATGSAWGGATFGSTSSAKGNGSNAQGTVSNNSSGFNRANFGAQVGKGNGGAFGNDVSGGTANGSANVAGNQGASANTDTSVGSNSTSNAGLTSGNQHLGATSTSNATGNTNASASQPGPGSVSTSGQSSTLTTSNSKVTDSPFPTISAKSMGISTGSATSIAH